MNYLSPWIKHHCIDTCYIIVSFCSVHPENKSRVMLTQKFIHHSHSIVYWKIKCYHCYVKWWTNWTLLSHPIKNICWIRKTNYGAAKTIQKGSIVSQLGKRVRIICTDLPKFLLKIANSKIIIPRRLEVQSLTSTWRKLGNNVRLQSSSIHTVKTISS